MVDWSGGNDTGPTPRKDAIWLGLVRDGVELPPRYLRNRAVAEAALTELIEGECSAGRRLLLGFDFPFGFPKGFAAGLTGCPDPFAVWEWLEARIEDTPRANTRFDLAGEINARFPGTGPFWFNGLKRDIAHLPRQNTRRGHGLPDRRVVENIARGAFTCWQMGGAGAVGGQVLTGLPVLNRLRHRFDGQLAVWPFEPLSSPVAVVEVWPTLINGAVKKASALGGIRDAHQVRLLARAVARLSLDDLSDMLDVSAPEEGWIMGLGHEDKLEKAASGGLHPPPLRDDCFALPAGVDWAPVDEAHELLRGRLGPVTGAVRLAAVQTLGRVLAEPVRAARANPPQPNSAVDGYAFAHSDTGAGAQVLPLAPGRSAAGVPYGAALPGGHALRILTGASLPEGADTVILQEDVTRGEGEIAFRGPVKRGANTREAGEDVAEGAQILPAGRVITPADLALMAATGVGDVTVREALRVAVISTGDELAEAGGPASGHQIYDANRPMLLAMLERFGAVPRDMGRVPDDRAALRAALDKAADGADAILTSGGASAGDEDHVSALLGGTGSRALWRIAIKPGRPLALGLWRGVPVFGLPGNPVAAMVCTLVFARPALGLLAGQGWSLPEPMLLPAGFAKSKKPGRREFLRARLRDGRVEVFASEGSGRISGLSWAEGLVELEDGAREIAPGDAVRYYPYSAFGL
ncbi:gephyrin-like molybdotransferase Glp [Salinihabitans flavidus]|nr:gephyrin-like molybdotransferase Glp [Salinihabitans flavidus]